MNYGKLFFPNTRREVIVESTNLQKDRAGNRSIKTGISMPLGDGKLVGMPSWVGDAYAELARVGCIASSIKFADLELSEMTIYAHTGEQTEKPAQTFIVPVINMFSMQRGDLPKKEGALPPVSLEFVAYINGSLEAWSWLYRHFRPDPFYMLFLNTQVDIEEPAPADPQMTLVREKDSPNDKEFEQQVRERLRKAVGK